MTRWPITFLISVWAMPVWAETPRLSLTLPQVIEATLQQSPELRVAEQASRAAQDQARAQRGAFLPTVALEGSARRVSEVPELNFPGGQKLSLTDNESFSLGPSVRYTLFKGRADYNAWRAALAQSRSSKWQEDLIRRQHTLAARLAYFQAQLACERVRLLSESYRVEEAQHRDIRERYNVGASAKIDLLAVHQQTLQRRRQLLDARSDLASAMRELTRLTNLGQGADVSLPLDGQTAGALPNDIEKPTAIVELTPVDQSVKAFSPLADARFGEAQPGIAYLSELADAARLAAKGLQGSRWPELTLLGRTSWDYPNGPIRETIHQNTIGASLNVPLFTGGQLFYAARAKEKEAKAAEFQRDAAARDLLAEWLKARDGITALRAQQALNATTIQEAEELARLQYQAYRAGRSRYLDVEDANLKVLQARTDAIQTDIRLLVQLARLDSLSGGAQ